VKPSRFVKAFAAVVPGACAALLIAAPLAAAPAPAGFPAAIRSVGGSLPRDPGPAADLVFVVAGDSRPTGYRGPLPRVASVIFDEIGLIRPAFALWSGDIIYGYGDSASERAAEYSGFESLARRAGVSVFSAPGNHDIAFLDGEPCGPRESEKDFAARFGALWGSFDFAGAHFILLDTAVPCHEDEIEGEQLSWLERDLEAHKDARAVFISTHTPFFTPPGIDPADGRSHPHIRNADALHDLFRRYPVRMVFSGHDHLFADQERDGIAYLIAAGGGAPLYAPPQRGGFSHYVVVRLHGGQASFDVIEPGRFYLQPAPAPAGTRRTWVVNSNDADLPARGIRLRVPAEMAPCGRLSVSTDLRRYGGAVVPVPVSTTSCRSEGSEIALELSMTVPRRASVPIVVERRRSRR
jgi:hypothetical protein